MIKKEANDDFNENECKPDDEDEDEMYDDKSKCESENDDEQVIEGVFVPQKNAEKQIYAKRRKKKESKIFRYISKSNNGGDRRKFAQEFQAFR